MKLKPSDKTVFTWHSWLGLFVGIFTLFLSITGTLLLFADEIDASLSSKLVKVSPGTRRFPLDSMVVTLKRTYPEGILQNVVLNTSHLDRAVIFQLVLDNQEQWVYWNPYTNQLNGLRKREDVLRQKILAWHEELTVGSLGHLFLFLVGMAMLGSVVSVVLSQITFESL